MYLSLPQLLPHLTGVIATGVELTSAVVEISARTRRTGVACPRCGSVSRRVHSRYWRRLADTPVGGRPVLIKLEVRRLFCSAASCPAVTFAEQVPGLTSRYARRTPLLRKLLERIGVTLAGRAGSRLATHLGIAVGRASLLRLVRDLPDPQIDSLKVLGVDDFALRRGHMYGTVLVDINTHTPVDLLADRSADTFAAWLGEHPGIEVVCRDRATTYAEATRKAAPNAIQVADRWHLWHNLAEHVEKTVAAHHSCLRQQNDIPSELPGGSGPAADLIQAATVAQVRRKENSTLVARTKARHQAVHALKTQGKGIKAIKGELGLSTETVRRFYRAGTAEELLAHPRAGRPSVLDPYRAYLNQRWNDGATNASTLYREITKQGYRGSRATVARYLAPFRPLRAAPPPTPPIPKVRHVTSWMLRHPDNLEDDDQDKLDHALAACPHLSATATHATAFAEMMTGLHGDRL
ncbi:ISL3 family transposase, partial [Actinopolymorpha sp. B9G3]|uniref:ISL3 family transposase n=1 Tax=Actinopolymorpha sp. B9G3 TaxID=3158970 RepID=UPI0032D8D69F